jgi:hypothetical protein
MRAFWYPLLGVPLEDLASLVDANETQIDAAGVNLLRYIAPGDEHDVLGDGLFDTEEVNGEMVVYWVTRLIESEPVDDVHCTEDTTGEQRSRSPVVRGAPAVPSPLRGGPSSTLFWRCWRRSPRTATSCGRA